MAEEGCVRVQDEFLSGRDNQVVSSGQMDFKGTLKERRMKYEDRRVGAGAGGRPSHQTHAGRDRPRT